MIYLKIVSQAEYVNHQYDLNYCKAISLSPTELAHAALYS